MCLFLNTWKKPLWYILLSRRRLLFICDVNLVKQMQNRWTEKGNMMARDGPHFFVETARHVYISIVIQYLMTSDIWCHVSTAVSSNIGSVSTVVRISNKACWEKRSASSSFPWRKELLACKIKDETTNCTTEI